MLHTKLPKVLSNLGALRMLVWLIKVYVSNFDKNNAIRFTNFGNCLGSSKRFNC